MATIKDIANRVGVSTCTVSRYINRKIVVKPETAERIDQAILDLDYRKNSIAVSLKTRRSKIIALVIPSLKNVFFAEIADNIASVLEKQGYSMVTFTSENDYQKELETCEKLMDVGADGAIFMTLPFAYQNGKHIERLQSHNVATLMINRFFEPNPFVTIATDFQYGVEQGTQLLIDRGRKKIGMIVGAENHPQSDVYRQAFTETMHKNGLFVEPYQIQNCYFSATAMETITHDMIDHGIEAIFGISDFTVLSSLRVIQERNLKMPRDIMLIGSGNTQFSELVHISSLHSRTDLLGQKAAASMLMMLQGHLPERFILVKPHIVERASTQTVYNL